jgi:catechol 2,3-dioxygenase-like lactoylglutathione lyase family enzyme
MAARFTHLALPCRDLDATIAWYEAHTPMRAFHRRVDEDAEVAWLAEDDTSVGLVIVQTFEAKASGDGDGALGHFRDARKLAADFIPTMHLSPISAWENIKLFK